MTGINYHKLIIFSFKYTPIGKYPKLKPVWTCLLLVLQVH